ncbi:prepilin-type N-terminal cleavage/methylation domain-containing protein [Gilvimarinus agarilyticus]|uniref:prepilin-type N-terminal cleavage/methylation domain-containing protein n=1 Tax=Gilvimarinus sp. 2_MG-2023 TaxID=3062666 RepID=UPI001C0A11EB|nr:prepilin-type N-terminal cleavage/methylation domain-containing protein [Gilvimarinus sp. 2_MG-2023]MBU2887578.1 prepilin-type N-terminal cleavage/methylation domain-containing protein [Gilvimarinus agarilyticus]MDO6572229.1 prepilin-type N-terminal cleavage/methylation domain-containing protein [Gilvimarinus sp. 2_MG-2023]
MRARHSGFTLIEVVVALTILSLIVTATLTAMRTIGKTQTTLVAKTENVGRMRSVSQFLRTSLERAKPVPVYAMGRRTGFLMHGDKEQLVWVTPMPIPGSMGGLVTVQLSVNKARQLVLKIRDGVGRWSWDDVKEHILAESVEDFAVSFSADPLAGQWVNQWGIGEYDEPPQRLQIELKVAGKYWPPIVVVVPTL